MVCARVHFSTPTKPALAECDVLAYLLPTAHTCSTNSLKALLVVHVLVLYIEFFSWVLKTAFFGPRAANLTLWRIQPAHPMIQTILHPSALNPYF